MIADRTEPFATHLQRLPKAELHVHLDGSLRPDTLLDLASSEGSGLPADNPAAIREFMRVGHGQTLEAYLERFDITLSVMQTAPALERIAFELAADLAAENTLYAEIRYSPVLHLRKGLRPEETVESVLAGLGRARMECGIHVYLIVCAIRSLSAGTSVELAELAGAFAGRGVVGFDLAGPEAGYPARDHAEAFRLAREAGLATTVHAGEAAGADSIREALHQCGADRIGHGTRLLEDLALFREVRDRRIPIEVCLTSNVQTGATDSYAGHPLRRFVDEGVVVSLNTDNRLMSDTTLSIEYERAHRHAGLTLTELGRLSGAAIESGFAPVEVRRELLGRLHRELAVMNDPDAPGR